MTESRTQWVNEETLRVETFRSGVFTFCVGLADTDGLKMKVTKVIEAHKRFNQLPLLGDVANMLEKEVVVSSVFGTNSIEGGTLTEEETRQTLELNPSKIKAEEERRVLNLKNAYTAAENFAAQWRNNRQPKQPFLITESMFKELHKLITDGLVHEHNIPATYRDNPKGLHTYVGDANHGGRYKTPTCREDIELLMQALIEWINSDSIIKNHPVLVRANLLHYYYERIHPFWDGNGRVGRVMEAMVLKAGGYKYASFALSRYYYEQIDTYFTLFNQVRKAEEKKEPHPNQAFVAFFLDGMLFVIDRLFERANRIIGLILYKSVVRESLDAKKINHRQYTIISQLLNYPTSVTIKQLQAEPWYKSLYLKLQDRTARRDWEGLQAQNLIQLLTDKEIRLLIPNSAQVE